MDPNPVELEGGIMTRSGRKTSPVYKKKSRKPKRRSYRKPMKSHNGSCPRGMAVSKSGRYCLKPHSPSVPISRRTCHNRNKVRSSVTKRCHKVKSRSPNYRRLRKLLRGGEEVVPAPESP